MEKQVRSEKNIDKNLIRARAIMEEKVRGIVVVCEIKDETEDNYKTSGMVGVHNINRLMLLEQLVRLFNLDKQDLVLMLMANDK